MSSDTALVNPSADVVECVHAFVHSQTDLRLCDEVQRDFTSEVFWDGLRTLGTRLWLDTGDVEAADTLWATQLSGLTTNNTLLNAEVQKGIYDDLIADALRLLAPLNERTRVVEVGFILNAFHGLGLIERFGVDVSVELHTDFAHDAEQTYAYGRRYYDICPEHFIVKVPLTPAGLLGARRLGEAGVPVNLTLGFSARHNHVATAMARPAYVNVFVGRLGAYVESAEIGTGEGVGEKATLASQRTVTELSRNASRPTLQIVASLRGEVQLEALAGVDVHTDLDLGALRLRADLPPTLLNVLTGGEPIAEL